MSTVSLGTAASVFEADVAPNPIVEEFARISTIRRANGRMRAGADF